MKNKLYLGFMMVMFLPILVIGKTVTTNIAANNKALHTISSNKNNFIDPSLILKKKIQNGDNKVFFIENKGQVTDQDNKLRTDIQYSFAAAGGLNVFIGDGAIHYQFSKTDDVDAIDDANDPVKFLLPGNKQQGATYTMYRMDVTLIGANKHAQVVREDAKDYYETYFNSGAKGTTAHAYGKIIYRDIYPNIDWVLCASNGALKHEFIVRKGGKVSDIKIKYGGVTNLSLNADGDLVANTPQGAITEHAPYTYLDNNRNIASSFKLDGNTVTYETGNYQSNLVIDPSLAWVTYYGGNGQDKSSQAVADDTGNVYMAGSTISTSNIATTGAYQSAYGGSTHFDAFLVKFNTAGTRLWATYFGNTGEETGQSVALDVSGNVYLAGITSSGGSVMSTAGAYQTTFGGFEDAFLAKFNNGGNTLLWSTYFGGAGDDAAEYVATDASGNVYLTGYTSSTFGIATSGSFQSSNGGGYDAYLAQFDASGSLQWATYYGDTGSESALGLAFDASGNVYMTGPTNSTANIATPGALQTSYGGGLSDAFLVQFDVTGAQQWATYYGGAGKDIGCGVATDTFGNVFLTGLAGSTTGIATAGSYQSSNSGGSADAFLVRFDNSGVRKWGTYFGGVSDDFGYAVATDALGNTYVTGETNSSSKIATPTAYQTMLSGNTDVFVAEFDTSGNRTWSTYYGGPGEDVARSIALDVSGNIYIAGYTASGSGMATPGAYQTTYGGASYDGFLKKLSFLPQIMGASGICIGSSVTLSNATGGGSWSSSNTSVASIGSSSGVVTSVATGTAVISYTVGSDVTILKLSVNPLPSSIAGATSVCGGSTITLSDAGGGKWSSSNTTVATVGTTGIVTGKLAGTTTITYTLSTGCMVTSTVSVSATPAAITGSAAVCAGATTTLSDAAGGGLWSCGNTSIATVLPTTGIVTGVSSGTASITYSLGNGCPVATKIMTVNTAPVSISGVASICTSLTTTLSDAGGGKWMSSNTTIATVGSGSGIVTGKVAGTATITYMLPTGCIATIIATVNATPAVIGGPSSACTGSNITLSDALAGGAWSSGNTSIAIIVSGSGVVTGVSSGTTNITYAMTSGCMASKIVTVNVLPSSIIGAATVCSGTTTTLSDAGGGKWTSGNTTVATIGSSTGVVTGKVAGTATITYMLATGCAATDIVTVVGTPATIAGAASVCSGSAITLSDATAGGSWSTATTSIATIGSSTGLVTGISSGIASVTYTIGIGCMTSKTITVNVLPASIAGTATVCTGATTTLTDAGGGMWSSSSTTIATVGTTGIVTGKLAGTANITYKIATGCIAVQVVTVNATPAAISGASGVCVADVATLSDAITSGAWSSDNTTVASIDASTGVVTGVAPGTANISYTLSNGCVDAGKTITVNPLPSAISGTLSVCTGTTTTLSDATPGGKWSSGIPSIATIGSATGIAAGVTTGTSIITYKLTTGCTAIETLSVYPAPAAISAPTVCTGATSSLSDAAGGGTWSTGSTSIATVGSASGDITGITTGAASITYTLAGCRTIKSVTVSASPAAITGAASVCTSATITLSDPGSGHWSSSNTSVASVGSTGVVTGVAAGTAAITYAFATGCMAAKTIMVNDVPSAITGTLAICAGTNTTLSDATAGGSWSSGTTTTATIGSSSGVVTGVMGPHTAIITYKLSTGCKAVATLTVNSLPAAITGTASVCVSATTTLSDAGAGAWSSNNTAIATIDASTGVVTGVSNGTTAISFSPSTGCTAVIKTVTVNPVPSPIESADTAICTAGTTTLSDPSVGGKWTSSTTTVATVGSSSGIVSAVAAGTSTITYLFTTGCNATQVVTVVTCGGAAPAFDNGAAGVHITSPNATGLQVYPNPNTGSFTLLLSAASDIDAMVSVTNTIGQKVMEFSIAANIPVPVTMKPELPAGIYIISVTSAGERYEAKVTVAK